MKKYDDIVYDVVRNNIELIDAGDFDKFFRIAAYELNSTNMANLASMFKTANIDPIPHMTYLPECWHMFSMSEKIDIPRNIQMIGHKCFIASDISHILIPSSVIEVGESAFENCDYLTTVLQIKVVFIAPFPSLQSFYP